MRSEAEVRARLEQVRKEVPFWLPSFERYHGYKIALEWVLGGGGGGNE